MGSFTASRAVEAPPETVWAVITDHDLYAEVAPNLSRVEVLEGDAEGMRRRCVDTDGNEWTETCTVWEPGRRYGMEVDVATSEFHRRLFDAFRGEWGVTPTRGGTRIDVRFEYALRYGPLGRLFAVPLRWWGRRVVDELLDNWERELRRRDGARTEARV